MKQLLIFLLTLFSVSLNAIDFAPIGAKWHYTRHTLNPNYETFGTIESIADTLIAGKVCQKLKEATTSTANWVVYSNDDSVFVYRNGQFRLLYDFGAMQGDTVTLGFSGANGTLKMIILSNSTIILNGNILRTQEVNCTDGIATEFGGEVIEGIGNTMYLFPRLEMSYDGPLRCYQDMEIGSYINPSYQSTDCEKIISEIIENIVPHLTVASNPGTHSIKIAGLQGTCSYELLDLKGVRMMKGQVTGNNIIQTKGLTKGLYLLRLTNTQMNIISKLIMN